MSESTPNGAASGRPGVSLAPDEPSPDDQPPDAPASGRLTCVCGHDRTHYLVSPVPTYNAWGKFWVIFMGVSTKPIRVDFQCRQCGRTFDFTEDSVELGEFI